MTLSKDLLGTSVLNQRPGIVSSATCATTPKTVAATGDLCTPVGTFNPTPGPGGTDRSGELPYGTRLSSF